MGEVKTIDELYADLQQRQKTKTSQTPDLGEMSAMNRSAGSVDLSSFSPYSSNDIYKTLNDGSRVAMYKDTMPGTDNNERLAQNQTGWEQTVNGLTKAGANIGSVVLGNTAGFIYGIAEGASTGNFNSVFDNSFSKTLDDWNTTLNYQLPNYYTKQEKEAGFFGSLIENPANFIANDMMNGLSFTVGTVMSEAIWAATTGGASLAVRAGRIGARLGQMGRGAQELTSAVRAGETLVGAGKFGKALLGSEKVAEGLAGYKGFVYKALDNAVATGKMSKGLANTLAKTGEILNTTRFIGTSSGNEAGIEAFHFKKEATENFYRNFEELNGRPPTAEESAEMLEKIEGAANNVFATNMAILGVSNLAMLGNLFKLKSPISTLQKSVNQKLFGIGVKQVAGETGELVFKGIERKAWQKGAGLLYKGTSPIAREGLFEEGLQGATTKTANNWIERQYDPKYLNKVMSLSDDAWKAMGEQYGTKAGWKEIGIGGIVGILGGTVTGEFSQFSRMAEEQEKIVSKGLNAANVTMKTFVSDINAGRMMTMAKVMEAEDRAERAMTKRDVVSAKLAHNDSMIALAEMYNNPLYGAGGLEQMERHGYNMIDTTEATDQEKQELKAGFKEFIGEYKSANNFANSIVGNQGRIYGTDFQAADVQKALTYTILQGQSSKKMMDESLNSLQGYMNSELIDAVKRNDDLGALGADKKRQVKNLSQQYRNWEKKSEQVQKAVQVLQAAPNEVEGNKQSRLVEMQQKLIEIENKKTEIRTELEGISKDIAQNKKMQQSFGQDVSNIPMTEDFIAVEDLLNLESKIDELEKSYGLLKEINPASAQAVKENMDNYKKAQQALLDHNSAIKLIASGKFKPQLADTNPFSGIYKKFAKGEEKADEHTSQFLTRLNEIRNSFKVAVIAEDQEKSIESYQKAIDEIKAKETLTEEDTAKIAELEAKIQALRKPIEEVKDDTPSKESKIAKKVGEVTNRIRALEEELKNTSENVTVEDTQSEIKSKKADIERRQEVERISKLPFQERIPALIKIGIIDSTISTQMGVRFPIIININGVKVPFYRSSNGTDGKTKGSWNPFFGFGKGKNGDSWLIKGNNTQFKNNYNSKAIEEYSKLLDSVLNWDTEVDKVRGVKNHPFMNMLEQVSLEEFNEKVYNTKDLNIINGTSGETNPLIYVDNRIKEINAKYDAELKELEKQPTKTTEQPNPRIKEIQKEINSLKGEINKLNPQKELSPVEALKARIEDILKLFKTSFVGTYNVDEAVKNRPEQKDIEKYRELLNQEPTQEFEELKAKFSQWRVYDSLAEDEQSVADLLDLVAQLETEVEQENTIVEPNVEDTFEELKKTATVDILELSVNTNYPVTVKLDAETGKYSITHMNPSSLLQRMNATNVTLGTSKKEVSFKEVDDQKKQGLKVNFISGGVPMDFTIVERGRISIAVKDFKAIPNVKTIESLSSWTYPNLYEQDFEGNWKPISSDFSDDDVAGDSNDLKEKDAIELFVNVNNKHNKELLDKYKKSKLTDKEKTEELENQVVIYIRKNGKNYGTIKGLTQENRKGVLASEMGIKTLREQATKALKEGNSGVIATTQVKYVQLGNPILNIDGNGRIAQLPVTDLGLKNIVATGFVQDGEITLSKEVKDVRRSFIKKISEKNKGKKVPIVVIKRGAQMIAFPIQMVKKDDSKIEDLYLILDNQDLSDAQKVVAINGLLIKNGIAASDFNLITYDEKIINAIADRLEANQNFTTAEQLADKKYDLKNLVNAVTIALDLINIKVSLPSQKFNIDLENLDYNNLPDVKVEKQEVLEKKAKKEVETPEVISTKKQVNKPKTAIEKEDFYRVDKDREIIIGNTNTGFYAVPTSDSYNKGYFVIGKEVYDKWIVLDREEKSRIDSVTKSTFRDVDKAIKGIVMEIAAKKRVVLGGELPIEVQKLDVTKLQVGDEAVIGGESYKVTGFAFGKAMISKDKAKSRKIDSFDNASIIDSAIRADKSIKKESLIKQSKVDIKGYGTTVEEAIKTANIINKASTATKVADVEEIAQTIVDSFIPAETNNEEIKVPIITVESKGRPSSIAQGQTFSVFDEELGIATQYTMTNKSLWEFGAGAKKYTTKETEFIDWMYEKSLSTFKVLRGKERQLKEQFNKEKELEITEEKIKCPISR